MELSRDKVQLCKIQGRLFELSEQHGLDSAAFADAFMNSNTAARLDEAYDRLQWAGEEYILEELEDELAGGLDRSGSTWGPEPLFWTGYVYRLWHYLTGEPSSGIVRTASPATMLACWPGYHTLDPAAAIARLQEAAQLGARG